MRQKLMIFAAALVGLAVPVTVAQSKTDPLTSSSDLSQTQTMRPMDDHSDVAYGDLSVFDTISTYGEDQNSTEPYCDQRGTLISTLNTDFAEKPKVRSPLPMNRSVELFASDIMGTWTAVYTRADGISCVVSSGIDWESGDNPIALLESEELLKQG
jgi:hypothetical protein